MNNDRRPSRPGQKSTTRVVRPATARVTPAGGVRPPTQRVTPGPASRPVPVPAANDNTRMIIIGASVAGGLVLVLALVMMSGGSSDERRPAAKAKPSPSASAAPKKPDVSQLIRDGQQKSEEGYQIIVSCQALIDEYHRSGAGSDELKEKLQKGLALLKAGNQCFNEAQEKSNGEEGFSDKKYNEAAYTARKIVSELK